MGVLKCWAAQAEVTQVFLRREEPLVPRLEKAEVQPCAVGPLPVTGVIPSVHGLANPAGQLEPVNGEHLPWLPSQC